MLKLRSTTPPQFVAKVLEDFDTFLLDHAACERKASATALSFVAHYPNRKELVTEMVALAQEELLHFAQTVALIQQRDLVLQPDTKDLYVRQLLQLRRKGSDVYFMDRLLLSGIIEARGCERFGQIASALPGGELKSFYEQITQSEARHHGMFVRLAKKYFDESDVRTRLDELLIAEAEIIGNTPFSGRLH